MLERLCDGVVRVTEVLTGAGFLALIVTVALQVLTRNVLHVPMLWTGDVARLLFPWLVFVGAAIGLRRGAHYAIDLLPKDSPAVRATVEWTSIAAGAAVAGILIVNGWALASLRASGVVQTLGISRFWLYLPIPLAGGLMALFLVEAAVARAARPR